MRPVNLTPPPSPIEPVTEVLHGVALTDPYRWLEDQNSPRTRQWIKRQTKYARNYLDNLPGRQGIQNRIRECLSVETYDSLQKAAGTYFFRKREPNAEQPSIYMRQGCEAQDQLLIDPAELAAGHHLAVKLLRVSPNGRMLLYEIKEGGERTGKFALFDVAAGRTLPDFLARGYLRGFGFAADGKSFYYVHEPHDGARPFYRAAYQHVLGTEFSEDREIFFAGEDSKLRLSLLSGPGRIGFLLTRFHQQPRTTFYLAAFDNHRAPERIVAEADYLFAPVLHSERVFAITDRNAPNLRIVELCLKESSEPLWLEVVAESDARIHQWIVANKQIFVSYLRGSDFSLSVFDLSGHEVEKLPLTPGETIRLTGTSEERDEIFIETESFVAPVSIFCHSVTTGRRTLWARRSTPFTTTGWKCKRVSYRSNDGTRVPMYLMGRGDVLASKIQPAVMTAYGGYGISSTPQFSIFVAFLVERGCLFALPSIRGGSEFGAAWHEAAKRRNRQTAYDDFLCAAEWLVSSRRTSPGKLAIFGGSNSGLLVAAAMTQRPELFRAVVCIAPLLDMLRYHVFDSAYMWKEEFGTAENPDDFHALSRYSPYQRVEDGAAYPATLIVSGDADGNCNPLHARKMTARLQAASASGQPILLDYCRLRGHSPVLPLSDRVTALADRMTFLCEQLGLTV